jgi:hypothetical protein
MVLGIEPRALGMLRPYFTTGATLQSLPVIFIKLAQNLLSSVTSRRQWQMKLSNFFSGAFFYMNQKLTNAQFHRATLA